MRPLRHAGALGLLLCPAPARGPGATPAPWAVCTVGPLPGRAVRVRDPAPGDGAPLEGGPHPQAAPALPQSDCGLSLSFPTTEPHGGCAEAGEPAWEQWLVSQGWAELCSHLPGRAGQGQARPLWRWDKAVQRGGGSPGQCRPVPGPPHGMSPHVPGWQAARSEAVRACLQRRPGTPHPPRSSSHHGTRPSPRL